MTSLSDTILRRTDADDMGLGKTIQVLSLLLAEQARNARPRPSLLVAPASQLKNHAKTGDAGPDRQSSAEQVGEKPYGERVDQRQDAQRGANSG